MVAKVVIDIDGIKHKLVERKFEELVCYCDMCSLHDICNPTDSDETFICVRFGGGDEAYFIREE